MVGEMVRYVLAEVQRSLGARQATSELEWIVLLACFMRSWDRAILTRINTWVNLESDPMSCSWMIPLPVSAGIACHRL